MLKKIFLSLSAIIVLSLPYQQQYAESAILSKVATKGAQKIVKEIIQDAAIETAMSFVLDQRYKMSFDEQDKYQKQADYELFCGKKMPDLITCEKPMQVKAELTETDKINIKNQSGLELEKLITGGKGLTKWQKFLDWFLPIWAVSFALTAITYAIDDDVRDLFNNAGYNALVALGIIKPVNSNQPTPLESVSLPPTKDATTGADVPSTSGITQQHIDRPATTGAGGPYSTSTDILFPWTKIISETKVTIGSYYNVLYFESGTGQKIYGYNNNSIFLGGSNYLGTSADYAVRINGVETMNASQAPVTASGLVITANAEMSPLLKKLKAIQYRTPYLSNGFYYTDHLYFTSDGNTMHIQVKSTATPSTSINTKIKTTFGNSTAQPAMKIDTAIFQNQDPLGQIIVPQWEELENVLDPIAESNYIDKYDRATLVPPSALPYTKTSTGETIEARKVPSPTGDPLGDEIEFIDPQGNPVPEDDITVGDPVVTPSPSGTPQVTPTPTPSNPNPQPINLSPPNTAPPIQTETPVFPEGESCDVGLKLPRFNPLMHTISDAFPFSIPFDLKDGFDAIFAEMGNEKPEFDYKFKFMGDEQSWKITIPDYFDNWKEFTDSFLIFIFDVGIIYAIFRFMGGGN